MEVDILSLFQHWLIVSLHKYISVYLIIFAIVIAKPMDTINIISIAKSVTPHAKPALMELHIYVALVYHLIF
jgi:hypothetical protein